MERKTFKITIDTPREKVWKVLWDEATYPVWTEAFSEGSRAETDWQEGSKVLFLSSSGEGMVSRIQANQPYEFMSFEHLGEVKDGVEDTESEAVKKWAGAMENYSLEKVGEATELAVEMDIAEDHKDYFLTTWPKALEKVKKLAEEA